MTFNELINKINQFIIANNNREITADILNPILKDIANYFSSQVGDLDNSSVSGSDVVAKINTLNTLISQVNGLVILTGESNPNDTPPANYTVGNMYLQSVTGLVLGLYIFNGTEWAVLKNWINDNITSDVLTWSSEKIVNYINNKNELISTNGYLLTDSSITFYAGARWRISNVIYTNINDITIPVPIANPGMYRTDLYVGNSNGQIVRVAGIESSTLEVAPNLPANTVAITESTTYGDHTNLQPAPNLDGLKPKIESGIVYFNDSGVLNNLNLVGQEGHLYLNAATELKSVNMANGFQPYDGKQLILTNNSTVNITIRNNASGTNIFTPFVFTTSLDYVLRPKESIVFYYSLQYGKFYFLSTNNNSSTNLNVLILDNNVDRSLNTTGVSGSLLLKAYTIPANTIKSDSIIEATLFYSKSGVTTSALVYITMSNTPNYMGHTLLLGTQFAAANRSIKIHRDTPLHSGNYYNNISGSGTNTNDYNAYPNEMSVYPINVNEVIYISLYLTVTNPVDTITLENFTVRNIFK